MKQYINEALSNLDNMIEVDAVANPVTAQLKKDIKKKYDDFKEMTETDDNYLGAKKQPVPKKVEVPKSEAKLDLSESLFEDTQTQDAEMPSISDLTKVKDVDEDVSIFVDEYTNVYYIVDETNQTILDGGFKSDKEAMDLYTEYMGNESLNERLTISDLKVMAKNFGDNPDSFVINKLKEPYDGSVTYTTDKWEDGVPVLKSFGDKYIDVKLPAGKSYIYDTYYEWAYFPYRKGWIAIEADEILSDKEREAFQYIGEGQTPVCVRLKNSDSWVSEDARYRDYLFEKTKEYGYLFDENSWAEELEELLAKKQVTDYNLNDFEPVRYFDKSFKESLKEDYSEDELEQAINVVKKYYHNNLHSFLESFVFNCPIADGGEIIKELADYISDNDYYDESLKKSRTQHNINEKREKIIQTPEERAEEGDLWTTVYNELSGDASLIKPSLGSRHSLYGREASNPYTKYDEILPTETGMRIYGESEDQFDFAKQVADDYNLYYWVEENSNNFDNDPNRQYYIDIDIEQ